MIEARRVVAGTAADNGGKKDVGDYKNKQEKYRQAD